MRSRSRPACLLVRVRVRVRVGLELELGLGLGLGLGLVGAGPLASSELLEPTARQAERLERHRGAPVGLGGANHQLAPQRTWSRVG
eukprot:scaffold28394_cov37-Phaeocystis_antarctica.AAC.1